MADGGLRIRLEYCQHPGRAPRAAWMAGEALSGNGESIAEFTLVPSTRGMFHIFVEDEPAAPRLRLPDARLFPDMQDMTAAILARV